MQIDPQRFLRLAEQAKRICFFDIEATGLRGDYNSVLVVSVRPFDGEAKSFVVDRPGLDFKVMKAAKAELEKYDAWVSYYGKGFDIPMLNTRLLRWRLEPIEKRHHIDLYFTLKSNLLMAHRSQAHLLEWLDTEGIDAQLGVRTTDFRITTAAVLQSGIVPPAAVEAVKKMTVSAEVWNALLASPKKFLPTMIKRCESDTLGLQALYKRTSHLIRDIKL